LFQNHFFLQKLKEIEKTAEILRKKLPEIIFFVKDVYNFGLKGAWVVYFTTHNFLGVNG